MSIFEFFFKYRPIVYEKGRLSFQLLASRWMFIPLALVAVAASYLNTLTAELAVEHMRTYKPDVYMPAHHDAPDNGLWRAIEPISEALKNDNPSIIPVSKEYLTPVCFNTEFSAQHGH